MALVYAGYTGALWGVMLITGKNVGFLDLFKAAWPPDVPGAAGTGANARTPTTASTAGRNVTNSASGLANSAKNLLSGF